MKDEGSLYIKTIYTSHFLECFGWHHDAVINRLSEIKNP
jgi:hypothetical protein